MKYCKKCGMLLEDTHEHCIRCGADVTLAENVSMYPIEVMKTIEEENKRKKASGKIVAMIIGLVIVLVGLIIFFVYGSGGAIKMPAADTKKEEVKTEEAPAETEKEPETAAVAEEAEEPTPTPKPSNRAVKDEKGMYFDYISEKDDAGNVVFTAIVPEDLTEREFTKDYQGACDRYPFIVYFTASTKENDIRFSYLSPRQLWYKNSTKGKSRVDEQDLTHYMSYCKYEDAKSYLEPLLKQSYPGAKLELKNEYDLSDNVTAKLEEFAKERNKELFGDIGDFAHIGKGTTYANMDYEFSAKVYEYEITLSDKNMLFCRYYVPTMAHKLTYAEPVSNDTGEITEWYNFEIISFETGNEDGFEDYGELFDVFIANALPTDVFMFINESYGKEIKKGVEAWEKYKEEYEKVDEDENGEQVQTADTIVKAPDEIPALDEVLLKKYAGDFKPDTKLDAFDTGVLDILRSTGSKCFTNGEASVYTLKDEKVAFIDKENNKVFVSSDDDEYPGDSFEELTIK